MSRKALTELPPATIAYLSAEGHTVVLATIDAAGQPDIDLISWVKAVDEKTLRFVVGAAHPATENMRRDGQVTLQLLGKDQVYAIKGSASVVKEKMEATKWPTVLFEMVVDEVRANMYGAGMVDGDLLIKRDDRVEELHQIYSKAVYTEIGSS
jgi:hypothetical protein